MTGSALSGKICLVTGATRGIGRGIALQLGEAGATVYITGRTLKKPKDSVGGSLEDTAAEISSRGGECIPVQCDHTKDEDIVAVFDRIKQEQDGKLDILVNNAFSAVKAINEAQGKPFWEQDDGMWDVINRVGLRNHYLCTVYACRMMVPRKQGLIVNVSSMGGLKYLFNVPYGIGKAAVDRMAVDCAIELRRHKVTMVSLWPGAVKTEVVNDIFFKDGDTAKETKPKEVHGDVVWSQNLFKDGQSVEFPGMCIVKLAQDPKVSQKTGRILMTEELGEEYGLKDIDGRTIPSLRSVKSLLQYGGWKRTANFVPSWIKVPYFTFTLSGSKF